MTLGAIPKTMKAVVLEAPYKVAVKEVPSPTIQKDNDVILKTKLAGLCGSDLHIYRGHQPGCDGIVIGHEILGTVVQVGPGVKSFKAGDVVLSPFSTSCGKCHYCDMGYTARCEGGGQLLGTAATPGCQAEYVRIPEGEASLYHAPADVPEKLMLLMADIIPTGYYVAYQARHGMDDGQLPSQSLSGAVVQPEGKKGVCVVVGCGPVGLCAITCAKTMFETVFATDLAPHRLEAAKKHGAIALPAAELKEAVLKATGGRGADAACEVVGHGSALDTAIDVVRPYGVVSSCGLHTHDVKVPGLTLYGKNLRLVFGRCSVRTYTPAAMQILKDNVALFESFVEHEVSVDRAAEYYELFEKNKIAKTAFTFE